jgi:hypothetical protein
VQRLCNAAGVSSGGLAGHLGFQSERLQIRNEHPGLRERKAQSGRRPLRIALGYQKPTKLADKFR